ncbi:TPM domain-containing protein [Gloeobacter kilaueensis]|uniref:Beta-propeller domains of methanol dehydrogenase type n=1 Tax=Gloeobacter kilaueensis (strain ATCC BAA-2537 / CCAP 1431/1 / ULC 316 / JS1) TaxID=1183438 RepID=U5QCU3_GLOK1|nr:TPM domain-containing protein [Gloeobacter kilaueensis]AGY56668.1 beta-propeller domains of methanol dehydrogenase type [Gloeobacter kilaueensis JS1]
MAKSGWWIGGLIALMVACPAAQAQVTLPQPPVPVVDLAEQLTPSQRQQLSDKVSALEKNSGFKVRVLTQKMNSPGRAVRSYWGLDDRSILVVLNVLENNPLDFNVGLDVRQKLPRVFWQELQGRYGNQFYVQDNGRARALMEAINAIDVSIRQGGRASVPGIPREHWLFTFVLSICGGLVAGFASHGREGEFFSWKGFLISSPMWFILFIAFGLGPVLTRTSDLALIAQNFGGFFAGGLTGFLIPTPKRERRDPNLSES